MLLVTITLEKYFTYKFTEYNMIFYTNSDNLYLYAVFMNKH